MIHNYYIKIKDLFFFKYKHLNFFISVYHHNYMTCKLIVKKISSGAKQTCGFQTKWLSNSQVQN